MDSKDSDGLCPEQPNSLLLSILIPAYNEQGNIGPTLLSILDVLRTAGIPFEIVVVNDNSSDETSGVVEQLMHANPEIKLVQNTPPGGLGRTVRYGLRHVAGDVIALVMADRSDDPDDIVRYYRKIEEGYDCVFGSRFIKAGSVSGYPLVKLVANRITNNLIRVMFFTRFNDLTNAFKAYRRDVIDTIVPLHAAHFNITIEMSLSALIRQYKIAQIPIRWTGKTWGSSNLRLREMGRRYLCTLLKIWFERLLLLDDLMADVAQPKQHVALHGEETTSGTSGN